MSQTKTIFKRVRDLVEDDEDAPLPLSVITNNMGINLCNIDALSWQRRGDGQLTALTIYFIPADPLSKSDRIIEEALRRGKQSLEREHKRSKAKRARKKSS